MNNADRLVDYSIRRTISFIREIDKLKENDFPYQHSEEALDLIKDLINGNLEYLNMISEGSDKTTICQLCTTALDALYEFIPLLGFIVRSTNVRNGFEFYGPLLRLSRQVLKNDEIRLVLSSEWHYSPLTYQEIRGLDNFILIGLPATESDNPLLIPLAGHELGHHLWDNHSIGHKLKDTVTTEIVKLIGQNWSTFITHYPNLITSPGELTKNLFALQVCSDAVDWAIRQSSELFCDFVGICIFGEAYLHAFAYLLAPGMSGVRPVDYPEMTRRINALVAASHGYGIKNTADYLNLYNKNIEVDASSADKAFLVGMADQAVDLIVPELIKAAEFFIKKSKTTRYSEIKVEEILSRFKLIVPAQNTESLSNILIAGWRAYHDPDLWKDVHRLSDKTSTLNELILKTIEVFEIEYLGTL
jgi:hypothetical protein